MAMSSSAHGNLSGRVGWAVPAGIVGGLAGGVVSGMMMQMMGMIPMVAMLVGSESVVVGWIVHLIIAAFIGRDLRPAGREPGKQAGYSPRPRAGIRGGLVGPRSAAHHAGPAGHADVHVQRHDDTESDRSPCIRSDPRNRLRSGPAKAQFIDAAPPFVASDFASLELARQRVSVDLRSEGPSCVTAKGT